MKKRYWLAIFCAVLALVLTIAAASADEGDVYGRMTDATDLHDGDRIILVSDDGSYYQAMATDFSGMQVTVSNNTITEQNGMLALTLAETDGGWLFASNDGCLAVDGGALSIVTDQADAAVWTISIASDGTATISCANGSIDFAEQDGAYRFFCGEGGNEIAIYNATFAAEQHPFGDGLWWSFANGKLTIGGSGVMPDFGSSSQPWNQHNSNIIEVEIQNSVTSIGNYAFHNSTGLQSITIPDSVSSIGKYAFCNCTGLTEITIPNSVTSIGNYAFSNCAGLTEITIPDGVESIGSFAFSGCTGLTSITLPCSARIGSGAYSGCTGITFVHLTKGTGGMVDYDYNYQYTPWYISRENFITVILDEGIQNIGSHAFYGCTGLTEITIPGSVERIGNYAFWNCTGLESITITGSVTSIGEGAFSGCTGLTEITIPDSVTSIDIHTFYDCAGLTEITIPDSVTSIGREAFKGCTGLTEITIPDSVTSIGGGAFSGCTGLMEIKIPDGIVRIGSDTFSDTGWWNAQGDGIVYYDYILLGVKGICGQIIRVKDGTRLIADSVFFNQSQINKITIPDSVINIGEDTFYGCTGLTSVTLPCSASVYSSTFSGCTGITSVHLTKGTGTMIDYNYNAPWYSSRANSITVVLDDGIQNIGREAFYDCTGLTEITIPDSVESIGEYAFQGCTGLTEITIPDSVTSIGGGAFSDCTGLTSVMIRNGVTEIGNGMFSGCTGLREITVPDSVTSIGDNSFSNCTGLASVTLGNGLESIGHEAFFNCTKLTEITIPDSVKSIESAFSGCTGLTSVILVNGLESIGSYAFHDCTGLESITIPGSVTSVGYEAFSGCTGLREITIPDSVTSIEWNTFYNCTMLASVTLPCSARIGSGAFSGCTGITFVHLTKGTGTMIDYDKYDGPSYYHYQVTPWYISRYNSITVILDDGIQNIGNYAFYNCLGLTKITIPDSVISLGNETFSGCTGLTEIMIPDSVESIGISAFYNCKELTEITIPDSVTYISDETFSGCTGLESITITGSATSIGERAFSGCTGLTSITLPCNVRTEGAFSGCTGISLVHLTKGTGGMADYDNHYRYTPWYISRENSITVILDEGIQNIGYYAFYGCTGLTEITIPGSVTSIGNYAFYNCDRLEDIYYSGTKRMRDSITIRDNNWSLIYSQWHYLTLNTIEWKTLPDKLQYQEEELLDVIGGVFTAYYDNEVVEDESLTTGMISGFDNTTAGEQTLTVTFEDKTLTYTVTVSHVPGEPVRENEAEPTCTESGGYNEVVYCTYCGEELSHEHVEIPALGHEPGEPVRENEVPSTYTAEGHYDEVVYCTRCHAELSRETHAIDRLPFEGVVEWNAEDVKFRGSTPYVIANGSAQTPRFTVKNKADGSVVDPANYDYEYRENTDAGTGYVIVTFKGDYEGTCRGFFKIYLPATTATYVENTAEGIKLTWKPVPGAAGYVIYRRAWSTTTNGWTEFKRWNNTTDTTYIDGADAAHKVYAGTRYQYGIKAYFAQRTDPVSGALIGGNVGDNFNLGEVGPLKTTVRITTRTLTAVTAGKKQMTIKWEATKNFTGIQVQYAEDTKFRTNAENYKLPFTVDENGNVVTPVISMDVIKNLISGKTYYVRIRSYCIFNDANYYGEWSNVIGCKVK